MTRKAVLAIALFTCCLRGAVAQLTVHVVENGSNKPLSNVLVRLHYGCAHSMHPVELKEKTNAAGVATFPSVSLSSLEFCVFPDYAYESKEQQFMFTSPQDTPMYEKYINKPLTALPADITFHVRRYTFGERVRNLFRYD